ncbi:MAG: RsbRD N-terminal domain-containing protein [Desulfotalea sp.]
MDISEGLRSCSEKIINQWVEYTLSTYDSSTFFIKEQDKFANPVGGNIRESLTTLFTQLIDGEEAEKGVESLSQLISIRSVQQFTPSQALAPLNAVKHIVRDILSKDKKCSHLTEELYDFEFAVDLTVLKAFDIYMHFRERLYQVRIDEIKSGSHVLTDSKCPSRLLDDQNMQGIVLKGKE